MDSASESPRENKIIMGTVYKKACVYQVLTMPGPILHANFTGKSLTTSSRYLLSKLG